MLSVLPVGGAWAACSAYKGYATINEVYRSGNSGTHFVEVKILDSNLTLADYSGWTVRVCNDDGQCSGQLSLSAADSTSYPWIIVGSSQITDSDWIDLSRGTDVILRDAAGNTIDYLSIAGRLGQRDTSCSPQYDWQVAGTNTHAVKREPDGTGDWAHASGNSDKETSGDTNAGAGLPSLSGSDLTVTRGQTANFVLSLSAPAATAVSISYETQDLTAAAGLDYTASSGTVTIPAGSQSVTVSVPTLATSAADGEQFYLVLTGVTEASVSDHYLLATINAPPIPAPLANWRMEESAGVSSVADSSGNGYDGSRSGTASTEAASPAIPGDPGSCRYGTFDSYTAKVSLPTFPDMTGEFTFTSWVYSTAAANNQTLVDDYDYKALAWWPPKEGYALLLDDFSGTVGRLTARVSDSEIVTAQVLSTNAWYFVALSLKPLTASSTRVSITAIDSSGAVVARTTQVISEGITIATGLVTLGNSSWNLYRLHGRLDESTYFAQELSLRQLQEVRQRTHPCAGAAIHHFEIGHAAEASTCVDETITVTACTNADCSSTYPGDVEISLSPDGWVGGDTQTISGGSGTLQLAREAAGEVTLAITASSVGADQPPVCKVGGSLSDCKVTFRDNVFVIDSIDPLGDVAVAGRPHQMRARLFTRDPATSSECFVATSYTSTKTLKAWYSPELPQHPAGANDPAVNATGLPSAGTTDLSLDFTAGVANFVLNTSDVGRFRLGLLDDTRSFATTSNISSTSSVQTVRPFGLDIGGLGSAADHNGPVFAVAGEPFPAQLRAVAWVAAQAGVDDADGDGVPDLGVDLSDNPVTPRFDAPVDVAHSLKLPLPGQLGTLSGGAGVSGFAAGARTVNLSWDEVGIIDLSVGLVGGSYLGSGVDVTGTAVNVGRFRPHRFEVEIDNDPDFAHACGETTYLGQPFQFADAPSLTVTAVNAGGVRTQNYEGDFWKLGNDLNGGLSSIAYVSNLAGSSLSGPMGAVDPGAVADVNGTVTVSVHAAEVFSYARPAAPVAPHDADVRLSVVVNDGEASGSGQIDHIGFSNDSPLGADALLGTADDEFISPNNALLRYGRVRLVNGYGPETREVSMPVRAEYFNGTGFVVNPDDACTALDLAGQFSLRNAATSGGAPQPGTTAMTIGAGSTSASLAFVPMIGGDAGLRFSAPAAGNTGFVLVGLDLTSLPWLQFDWDANGSLDNPPSARATFGIYRGNDRVIYTREAY